MVPAPSGGRGSWWEQAIRGRARHHRHDARRVFRHDDETIADRLLLTATLQ
jgi:hypothetical protein